MADIVIQVVDTKGRRKKLWGLLDTGCTSSIFLEEFMDKATMMDQKARTTFKTYGGTFTAKKKNRVSFRLPELDNHKKVTFVVNVDNIHDADRCPYDAIIGTDIIGALGIDIKFSDRTICWGDLKIPMKKDGAYRDRKALKKAYLTATGQDKPLLTVQEERQNRILDADYSKVDVDSLVDTMAHISLNLRKKLKRTLTKFPDLFLGGLGRLKGVEPIHLEIA